MVIQRNWKTQSDNNVNNVSSSEDSNSSTISLSKGQQQQVQKFVTTPQMAENVLSRLKQRFGTGLMYQKSYHEAEVVMRSLELLRINIQSAFDKEIDEVVKKFVKTYFQPAFKNIKNNLGDHAVSDEIILKMSCAMIENSKSQYTTRTSITALANASQASSAAAQCHSQHPKNILILTKNATTGEQHFQSATLATTNKQFTNMAFLKRPCSTIDLQQQMPVVKKPLILQQRIINPQIGTQQQQQNYQQNQLQQVSQHQHQQRRQIFWNTANITTETRFLLDVQANQAFGFGVDGRERLASKHPELIRYLPDSQDREWLVHQKIIPMQNRNSRFLFLVFDEVIKLSQNETYKKRETLNLSILHAFKIPNFIIQKMKVFFIDLNIKSRGLITNSHSGNNPNSTVTSSISSANTKSENTASSTQTTTTATTTSTTSTSNINATRNITVESSSHLRNALLQRSNSSDKDSNNEKLNNLQQRQQSSSNLPLKPKSSLSSSHATLTALLNNSNNSEEN